MVEKEFVWRGLTFVWDGRRRAWICKRPREQSGEWWVTLYHFNQSHLLKEGEAISWESPPEDSDFRPGLFANAGWMAHFGFGDAALRDSRDDALEAAMSYALRFHHASIAQLRGILGA